MQAKIAIIEDDREISRILAEILQKNGYETMQAYDGRQAMALFDENEFDLILMDLMLPFISGEQLILGLRKKKQTPVIVISAKSMMETKLEVLRLGADDYIIKPFDINEVIVRVEVVLRRSATPKDNGIIKLNGLNLYLNENRASYNDVNIPLTAKEFMLLSLFMKHPKKTYTKAELYENVWNDVYYYEDNTINVHVSNLRQKLKKASGLDFIETVWGIGYRLRED